MIEDILLDVRELVPPEPLEKVLEALCHLLDGQRIHMMLDREPFPLYSILERNGLTYRTGLNDEGDFEVLIWKPLPA
jgi:uncharacterized protein (DUF2249 family)